ncbi:hypothetical protein [Streptomyces turgidiscabies]|uniref:Secreted protein n=1 Tax=Streptomyces turgidiscabies TaxID=85558 RepID=A0ABU0RRV3_9ACTN|nr:hypothetical protein [Streptomyces turgidiscabies]MDQ0934719.1 hypothetical protein [Streptomyces turgidiscabies]
MTVAARRLPSSVWVTGLTVAAVAVVAALAVKAVKAEQGPQPHVTAAAKPKASASTKPSAKPSQAAEVAVPDGSGTGRRVVYSLGQKRAWLVDASEQSRRTFVVWPGTVSPDPGRYSGWSPEVRTDLRIPALRSPPRGDALRKRYGPVRRATAGAGLSREACALELPVPGW